MTMTLLRELDKRPDMITSLINDSRNNQAYISFLNAHHITIREPFKKTNGVSGALHGFRHLDAVHLHERLCLWAEMPKFKRYKYSYYYGKIYFKY